MNKRVVEHEIKLEKSVKVILGVLALGVLLNAFAPAFSDRESFALESFDGFEYRKKVLGGEKYPVHIICESGCTN